MVITLFVADYTTLKVLVDNGSSTDILYYPTFKQIRIDKKRLLPSNTPLMGFGKTKVFPIESVALPVTINTYLL